MLEIVSLVDTTSLSVGGGKYKSVCMREDREREGIVRYIYLTPSFHSNPGQTGVYHERELQSHFQRKDLVKRPGSMNMKGVSRGL